MNRFVHGPAEILRFPDGHYMIVTQQWWKKFLTSLLTEGNKVLVPSRASRSTGIHGLEAIPKIQREERATGR